MSETEPTGFENVAAAEAAVNTDELKLAVDQAALAAIQNAATPAPPAPAEPVPWQRGLSPAQIHEAELAESARQAALHATAAANHPPVDQLVAVDDSHLSEAARINKQVYERIYAARHQPVPPPPPPQPVAPAILAQTQREMAEGRRIAQRHAEQQATAVRRPPSAREVAAQGTTTPIFVPGDFVPKP